MRRRTQALVCAFTFLQYAMGAIEKASPHNTHSQPSQGALMMQVCAHLPATKHVHSKRTHGLARPHNITPTHPHSRSTSPLPGLDTTHTHLVHDDEGDVLHIAAHLPASAHTVPLLRGRHNHIGLPDGLCAHRAGKGELGGGVGGGAAVSTELPDTRSGRRAREHAHERRSEGGEGKRKRRGGGGENDSTLPYAYTHLYPKKQTNTHTHPDVWGCLARQLHQLLARVRH